MYRLIAFFMEVCRFAVSVFDYFPTAYECQHPDTPKISKSNYPLCPVCNKFSLKCPFSKYEPLKNVEL